MLGVWRPEFPSAEAVRAAADLFPAITPVGGQSVVVGEGPRWEIVISPGVIRVRTRDYARGERAKERSGAHERARVAMAAAFLVDGKEPPSGSVRGRITSWSRKSRARLVARLSDLDYTRLYGRCNSCRACQAVYDPELARCPQCGNSDVVEVDRLQRLPAMLTLTYPGEWVSVASSGQVVKAHLAALRQRYARAWGEPLVGVWKLEFQARGAPHFHISTTPPMGLVTVADPDTGESLVEVDFRRWLSLAWAEVVGHPDPGERARHRAAGTRVDYAEGIRMSNPRRMAIYFAKYGTAGSKEYQHQVPAEWQAEPVGQGRGPGRFWGYWGLGPLLSICHVSPEVGIAVGRVLRRWLHAQGRTRQVTVTRVDQATGRVRYRRSHTRLRLLINNRGFVIVRDGPAVASQLARYLDRRWSPSAFSGVC